MFQSAYLTLLRSAITKILRAQYGYDLESDVVAGTDELSRINEGKAIDLIEIGLELHRTRFSTEPETIDDILSTASERVMGICRAYMISV
jgi:hypothetical protein